MDQNNRPFTDKDLHGKHSLLYFGFTNCPDICPDELVKLAGAIDDVGATGLTLLQLAFLPPIDLTSLDVGQGLILLIQAHEVV